MPVYPQIRSIAIAHSRVAHELAEQRHQVVGTCSAELSGTAQLSAGMIASSAIDSAARRRPAAACASFARARRMTQLSAARPFSANMPCGRRWMKRMMKPRTKILPSTAPETGSSSLLTTPRPSAGEQRAGQLADAAEHHDHERVHDVALAELGTDVADLRQRDAAQARDARADAEGQRVDARGANAHAARHARGSG